MKKHFIKLLIPFSLVASSPIAMIACNITLDPSIKEIEKHLKNHKFRTIEKFIKDKNQNPAIEDQIRNSQLADFIAYRVKFGFYPTNLSNDLIKESLNASKDYSKPLTNNELRDLFDYYFKNTSLGYTFYKGNLLQFENNEFKNLKTYASETTLPKIDKYYFNEFQKIQNTNFHKAYTELIYKFLKFNVNFKDTSIDAGTGYVESVYAFPLLGPLRNVDKDLSVTPSKKELKQITKHSLFKSPIINNDALVNEYIKDPEAFLNKYKNLLTTKDYLLKELKFPNNNSTKELIESIDEIKDQIIDEGHGATDEAIFQAFTAMLEYIGYKDLQLVAAYDNVAKKMVYYLEKKIGGK
jgi:lipoprotein